MLIESKSFVQGPQRFIGCVFPKRAFVSYIESKVFGWDGRQGCLLTIPFSSTMGALEVSIMGDTQGSEKEKEYNLGRPGIYFFFPPLSL